MRHGHGMAQRAIWYPLSWWQALLVFLVAQVLANMGLALLREAGVFSPPPWLGGGIGGGLGVIGVMMWANALKKREPDGPKQ